MTHILLGAILAVLVYALMWRPICRPWLELRRRLREIERQYEPPSTNWADLGRLTVWGMVFVLALVVARWATS